MELSQYFFILDMEIKATLENARKILMFEEESSVSGEKV